MYLIEKYIVPLFNFSKVVLKAMKGIQNVAESDLLNYVKRAKLAKQTVLDFTRYHRRECPAEIVFIQPAETFVDYTSTMLLKRFDKRFTKNEFVVFEDRLKGDFKTFVSSEGAVYPGAHEKDALTAFSHFTYHYSDGENVICNFKVYLMARRKRIL